ncbi:UNVERIFIED_CONTAM: hypothetical protein K2H54_015513 [Gekko kuhli]
MAAWSPEETEVLLSSLPSPGTPSNLQKFPNPELATQILHFPDMARYFTLKMIGRTGFLRVRFGIWLLGRQWGTVTLLPNYNIHHTKCICKCVSTDYPFSVEALSK